MLFKVSKNIFFYLLCLDSNSMFFSPRILSPSTRLITVKRLIIFLKTWSTVEIIFSPTLTTKELTLCHKLSFSKPYIFGTKCCRPQIFQTMHSVRSNNQSLKYQRFTTLGSKDICIRKSEFVAKAKFFKLNLELALLEKFSE